MTSKVLGFGAIVLIVTALVAVPTRATTIPQQQIDFLGGAGGTLSYVLGVGKSLTINNASIIGVTAFPAFVTLPITSGSMSFTTAGCVLGCFANIVSGGATTGSLFNYGGSLTLIGQIKGMLSPQTLLMGTFSPLGLFNSPQPNATLSSVTGKGGFNGGLLISQINPILYTDFLPLLFQVPGSSGKGYLSEMFVNLSFAGNGFIINHRQLGTWNGAVKSTDLLVKPVPEPSSLLLIGTVFLVAAGLLRRKLPKLTV